MATTVDPLAVTRTSGTDPLAVVSANSPAAFDPNNPLGLSAAAPGYLPAAQRAAQPDPDLGWSPGMSQTSGPGVPLSSLPVDLQNSVSDAQKNWANMDQAYWTPREQSPTPLVLGALGAIAAPFALSALGIGGAAGAAGAGATDVGSAALPAAASVGTAGAGALAGPTVSELVVSGAASGLSIPAIAASVGLPAATVGSILSSSGGSNTLTGNAGTDTVPASASVPELTVQAPAVSSATLPIAAAGAAGLGALATSGGGSTPFDPTSLSEPNTVAAPVATPASTTPPGLLNAIKSGDPSQIGSWIAANPLQAVSLGLLSASALASVAGIAGAGSGSSSGNYTPVTLPASFSATSPHFAVAPRGTPRVMPAQDWTKYGQGPEQSFFTGITTPAAPTNLTVPSKGFAHGGFAVKGAGDGRSDSIDARLSDGEYVVDAETVALLGNGSNKAGADKLDQFRVNLRKAKGRDLARGDFSVSAKAPSDYMAGAH